MYVPPNCTPWAQPADRGIIALLKSILRKKYSTWVALTVCNTLQSSGEFRLDLGTGVMKKMLAIWVGEALAEMNCSDQGKENCHRSCTQAV